MSQQLDVPGGGSRDLPARQQTLEQAIAWSYDLLDAPSRRLLARLSLFAGGFRLEEGETVGGPDGELGIDVIEGLTTLADHSLVQPMAGPDLPRFRLLETIRRFAAARLSDDGETETTHRRHAAAYLAFAEEAALHMPGRDQVPWLDRLSVEHDNLRGAMAWAIEAGDAEVAHRLLAAIWRFWQIRGHVAEGGERADHVLAMPGADGATTWRMRAVEAAGGLAYWGAGLPVADQLYQSQLELARELGDEQGIAAALFNLVHTRFILTSDPTEVARLRAEAEALYRKVGDESSLARLAFTGAFALMAQGDVSTAEKIVRESLETFEALGDGSYIPLAASSLAGIAMAKGELDEAVELDLRSYLSTHEMGDIASITFGLRTTAVLMYAAGLPGDAATLLAAFEAHCRRFGVRPPLDVEDWMGLGSMLEELRAAIASGEFEEDVRLGASMTTDAVIEFLVREAVPRFKARPGAEAAAIPAPTS